MAQLEKAKRTIYIHQKDKKYYIYKLEKAKRTIYIYAYIKNISTNFPKHEVQSDISLTDECSFMSSLSLSPVAQLSEMKVYIFSLELLTNQSLSW